ncbi:MAG: imidazole glycerol phosphate synthase subunit HisH [Minwuia sp.]|uniref:imidazole glycerol phosphate synthase subunit HisH n=1 Tax=Minwuia sp. TaxID=2493630 RepID=UPI003A8A738C
MSVVIVDYGSGNLHSAAKAFERQAATLDSPPKVLVSGRPEDVRAAERLVLPGVGAFGDCRDGLRAVAGLWEAVAEFVEQRARPFFGICVGMQLMARQGLEHGTHDGFGWIDGVIDRIVPSDPSLKIPHMGWNELQVQSDHPVFRDLGEDPHAYFVHSYAFAGMSSGEVLAKVEYGGPVVAAVGHGHMIGTQFHPEKSQHVGLTLIRNFLTWSPG